MKQNYLSLSLLAWANFFLLTNGLFANEEKASSGSPPISIAEEKKIDSVPIPPGPFNLQTCFELAVLQSETLGMKEEDIRVAQARYWQAIGSILPNAHVLTTESYQNNSSGTSSSGTNAGTTRGASNFSSGKDHFSLYLNIKQPIFSGFREYAAASANQAEVQARKHEKQRNLELLYLDVVDVFYQILMYQQDLQILEDTKNTLENRIAEVEKRTRLGKSRAGDAWMAKSQLADTLVTVEQVRGLLGASTAMMNFLTGLSVSTFELKDTQKLPNAEALEIYLNQTQERPDILAAIQMEKAARKKLSAAKGEHWPTISAEGNYYLKDHPQGARDWNIILTCDLPLFEGGVIEARIREQKALVQSSELSLAQLRRTADKDVHIAYGNFLSSVAQVARLQEAKAAAEENYRVQEEDYQHGVASHLEKLDALTQMYDARRRLVDTEVEAQINLIRLHVAAGAVKP